jgi:hypothetical protein
MDTASPPLSPVLVITLEGDTIESPGGSPTTTHPTPTRAIPTTLQAGAKPSDLDTQAPPQHTKYYCVPCQVGAALSLCLCLSLSLSLPLSLSLALPLENP